MFYVRRIEGNSIYVMDTEDDIEELAAESIIKCAEVLGVEEGTVRVYTNEDLINYSKATYSLRGLGFPFIVEGIKLKKCVDIALTEVKIPYGVEIIAPSAFSLCCNMQSIEIPSSVRNTNLYVGTFWGCKSLRFMKIPNSVITISGSAFHNCESLQSVEIPSSVEDIADNAFLGCKSLVSIRCVQGSYAESYANRKGIAVEYIQH